MILTHFWKRWRGEYLLELRNAHNQLKKKAGSRVVSVGDLVLFHDKTHPRSCWKMGKVERLLMSKDGESRGAEVRVQGSGSSRSGLLRRPLRLLLYPLEVSCSTNEAASQEQVPVSQNSQRKVERDEIESGVELQSRESEKEDSGLLNYKTTIKFVMYSEH